VKGQLVRKISDIGGGLDCERNPGGCDEHDGLMVVDGVVYTRGYLG